MMYDDVCVYKVSPILVEFLGDASIWNHILLTFKGLFPSNPICLTDR